MVDRTQISGGFKFASCWIPQINALSTDRRIAAAITNKMILSVTAHTVRPACTAAAPYLDPSLGSRTVSALPTEGHDGSIGSSSTRITPELPILRFNGPFLHQQPQQQLQQHQPQPLVETFCFREELQSINVLLFSISYIAALRVCEGLVQLHGHLLLWAPETTPPLDFGSEYFISRSLPMSRRGAPKGGKGPEHQANLDVPERVDKGRVPTKCSTLSTSLRVPPFANDKPVPIGADQGLLVTLGVPMVCRQ